MSSGNSNTGKSPATSINYLFDCACDDRPWCVCLTSLVKPAVQSVAKQFYWKYELLQAEMELDDFCQEIWLKLLKSLPRYEADRGAAFRTWLYDCCRYAAREISRTAFSRFKTREKISWRNNVYFRQHIHTNQASAATANDDEASETPTYEWSVESPEESLLNLDLTFHLISFGRCYKPKAVAYLIENIQGDTQQEIADRHGISRDWVNHEIQALQIGWKNRNHSCASP